MTDTALAILFARSGDTTCLHSFLENTNSANLAAVEPVLLELGEVGALCALLRVRGDEGRILDIWQGCVLFCTLPFVSLFYHSSDTTNTDVDIL